jgi:predicted NUDIX family phosphoesterase
VLELFLKRNGIKAEVFTERASIAPIKSKGHLNFNVWVSCASLQGALEALYRELDVFILDRGVFDTLVWNEWLKMTGKITSDEAEQVANFFTMKRWTELIDIVFVLTCDPKTSIEREYAEQLTTKRGTIMSEGTLTQFAQAARKALDDNRPKFKKIVEIDTTSRKTIDCVAEITDVALTSLAGFLDEAIAVIPATAVSIPERGFFDDASSASQFVETVNTEKQFLPRSAAEANANVLQPIPCAILRFEDKVLLLRRKKPGHPLHDKYDVWSGGHVNAADDGANILLNTLHRELNEEVFIKEAFELDQAPIGLVRTNEDARASRHIGVVYTLTLRSNDVALAMNQKEFRSTRGSSMSGRLVPIDELGTYYRDMGDWSRSIVDGLWPHVTESLGGQKALFENEAKSGS